jgi:hypothetical protein
MEMVTIKKYINESVRYVSCSKKEKKRLYQDLSDSIDQFLIEHPTATMEDIVAAFGAPEEFGTQYISNRSPEELSTNYVPKYKWRLLKISVFCIILAMGIYMFYFINAVKHTTVVMYTDELIEETIYDD